MYQSRDDDDFDVDATIRQNLEEKAKRQFESYVEYGKKLESIINKIS